MIAITFTNSDGRCKVVQVVAFEVEESPFYVADALTQSILAEEGVDGIGIAATFTHQEKLLFCQLFLDVGHGGFLLVHLVLEVVDAGYDLFVEIGLTVEYG